MPIRQPSPDSSGQQFLRMDVVNSNSTPQVWVSRIMTVTHGQVITLEHFATDQQELERLETTATLKMLDTP